MADIDLPVFPFRINWRDGVTERLSWLTDVLAGKNGNEQRRAIRLSPRREFEATLTLFNRERSFFDLWLHRMLDSEMMFPVWPDAAPMTAGAAKGAVSVPVWTEGLSFEAGGLALILGPSAFEAERVEIVSVQTNSLTIEAPGLAKPWGRGSRIAPLKRGRLAEESSTRRITEGGMESQARFEVTVANDHDEGEETADIYASLPVLTIEPDAVDDTDYSRLWNFEELDPGMGLRYRVSDQGRAMMTQRHTRLLRGRLEKQAFREMLYRQQGRLAPLWLPTFNVDFVLARTAANAQTYIEVEQCGYGYTGGPTSGREHICIDTRQGRIYRKITATAPPTIGGRERLNLDSPLPREITVADVRRISFMDTARLDTDMIELFHVNDADGLAKTQLPYRTFRNDRVAPLVIEQTIPTSAQTLGGCGAYPEGGDPCNDVTPAPVFEGWYMKVAVRYPMSGIVLSNPSFFMENLDNGAFVLNAHTEVGPGPWGWSQIEPPGPFGIEFVWTADVNPLGSNLRLHLQFPAFTVPGGGTARIFAKRWDDVGGYGSIPPDIPIFGTWPASYDFTF